MANIAPFNSACKTIETLRLREKQPITVTLESQKIPPQAVGSGWPLAASWCYI